MFLFRSSPQGLFHNARIAALCCVAGIFLSLSTPFAHEGHEDDDATRLALASSTYPRVTAHSELYELVGVVRGERLSIYLDHFATNEPVTNAKMKVAIGDTEPVRLARYRVARYRCGAPVVVSRSDAWPFGPVYTAGGAASPITS
jgi:cobalt-zinc-cadmium efflux system membrane fusion protein